MSPTVHEVEALHFHVCSVCTHPEISQGGHYSYFVVNTIHAYFISDIYEAMQKMELTGMQRPSCNIIGKQWNFTVGHDKCIFTPIFPYSYYRAPLNKLLNIQSQQAQMKISNSDANLVSFVAKSSLTNNDRHAIIHDVTPYSRYHLGDSHQLFVSLQSSFVTPICDPLT